MKKLLALVLVLMMAMFALTACTINPTAPAATEAPVEEATEAPAEEATEAPAEEATEAPAEEATEAPAEEATEAPAEEATEAPVEEAARAVEEAAEEAVEEAETVAEEAAAVVEEAAETVEEAATDATEETPTEGKTYTVGVCQLVQHVALDAATQGFQDALTEKLGDAVTFDVQNASGDTATCTTIMNSFVSENVDLIMANATPALQAAQAATGDIPILGTSVTDYGTALDIADWTGTTGINISGTTDLAPLDGQADMIKELFPEAKTIGMLYCSAEANSVYQIETIKGYLTEMGYECIDFAFTDSNDVASVTESACASCDVLYVPTDNTAASCTEAIRNVVEPAKKAVIAGEEGICSGCGVATLSIKYYDLGYATGEMAYEILVNGADVSTMPVQTAPNFTKEYNAELCDILGITVPEDYVAIGA